MTLNVGDYFWEYNSGVGYKRKAHSALHVEYFWKNYGTRAFFTVKELLAKYPNAEVTGCNSVEGSMTLTPPYRRCDRL